MYYCFCTESYMPWLRLLVRSLRRVDRHTPILVHFSGDVEKARGAFCHLPNMLIREPVHPPSQDAAATTLLELRLRNVLAVARHESFPWLLVLDADLLVRRPLTRLVRSMALYDFGAVIRGASSGAELAPHLQVAAGFYLVTKRGISIVEEANRLIASRGRVRGFQRGSWFRDQACLAEAILTSDLRIRSVPRELYLSSRPFDPRAAVWNANFAGAQKLAAFRVFERELDRLYGGEANEANNRGRSRLA
jgi:hypothetical protein